MNILSGFKTYIVAVIMVLSGVAEILGVDVPGVEAADASRMIMEGLAFFFVRAGIKTGA